MGMTIALFDKKVEKIKKIAFLRSSRNFATDIEEPSVDRLYSSGNGKVKKRSRPWGTGSSGFFVPSLLDLL